MGAALRDVRQRMGVAGFRERQEPHRRRARSLEPTHRPRAREGHGILRKPAPQPSDGSDGRGQPVQLAVPHGSSGVVHPRQGRILLQLGISGGARRTLRLYRGVSYPVRHRRVGARVHLLPVLLRAWGRTRERAHHDGVPARCARAGGRCWQGARSSDRDRREGLAKQGGELGAGARRGSVGARGLARLHRPDDLSGQADRPKLAVRVARGSCGRDRLRGLSDASTVDSRSRPCGGPGQSARAGFARGSRPSARWGRFLLGSGSERNLPALPEVAARPGTARDIHRGPRPRLAPNQAQAVCRASKRPRVRAVLRLLGGLARHAVREIRPFLHRLRSACI